MSKQCTLPHILLLFVIVYQIQGSNVPNLSIGANGDIYYCLLYNDSSDSTITWDYSNKFFNRYDGPESEYFYCYINSTKNMCSRHKDDQGVFVSSYWDGPPVLNHLWQEFTLHKLYPFEKRSYNINLSNGFQRSFSLKMKDVDILLCNKKNIVSDCVTKDRFH
ncbi:hypothetical protein QE152_g13910 [Popillia japonica]|uniref:Uncharacterized protein n=1 Tax=Popillia japonica TaxID=7064 RepID=A0AAW1LAT1_POPJA